MIFEKDTSCLDKNFANYMYKFDKWYICALALAVARARACVCVCSYLKFSSNFWQKQAKLIFVIIKTLIRF